MNGPPARRLAGRGRGARRARRGGGAPGGAVQLRRAHRRPRRRGRLPDRSAVGAAPGGGVRRARRRGAGAAGARRRPARLPRPHVHRRQRRRAVPARRAGSRRAGCGGEQAPARCPLSLRCAADDPEPGVLAVPGRAEPAPDHRHAPSRRRGRALLLQPGRAGRDHRARQAARGDAGLGRPAVPHGDPTAGGLQRRDVGGGIGGGAGADRGPTRSGATAGGGALGRFELRRLLRRGRPPHPRPRNVRRGTAPSHRPAGSSRATRRSDPARAARR